MVVVERVIKSMRPAARAHGNGGSEGGGTADGNGGGEAAGERREAGGNVRPVQTIGAAPLQRSCGGADTSV